MKKRYWKEIEYPKNDIEYWVVYNPYDEMPHYFEDERNALNYANFNDIPEVNIMKECFN